MNWLAENSGNIIVLILLGGLLGLCIRNLWQAKKKGCSACSSCGHECGSCPFSAVHHPAGRK